MVAERLQDMASRSDDDRRLRPPRLVPLRRRLTSSCACVRRAKSRPVRRDSRRSRIGYRGPGMEKLSRDPRCAPRCSASWTSRPRALTSAIWLLTSLLSWAVEGRVARDGFTRRVARRAGGPCGRGGRRASPCTGWPSASSSVRTRGRGPTLGALAPARRPASTCSARRPSPPPRPTVTRSAATRRCAPSPEQPRQWPSADPRADSLGDPPRQPPVKVTALTAPVSAEAPEPASRTPPAGCAHCCARPRVGAHLHVDIESMDSRDLITGP